jgi:hypothetical protein
MKPFWHEISQSEIDGLVERKVTTQFVIDNYSQPTWCSYPDALMGVMGCWSLTDNEPNGLRTNISPEYCATCPCFKMLNSEQNVQVSDTTVAQ